ncbi:MAG: hypothetical protein M1449_02430 [Candidatus Thermoplasmatota archaeon]|nr:hypothetical protein [Candidatus Thermoplasmatota archaeon]
MTASDLFPELLPAAYEDDDEARALAWGLVCGWFGTLSYRHSESAHCEILDSLESPAMAEFVADASLHLQDARIDFDMFAAGIRHQARRARAAGLVLPDGKPRQRREATLSDMLDDPCEIIAAAETVARAIGGEHGDDDARWQRIDRPRIVPELAG